MKSYKFTFYNLQFIFSPVLCSLAATYSSRGGALAGTVGTYAIPAVFVIYLTLGVLIRFKLSQSVSLFVWLVNEPNQIFEQIICTNFPIIK
jgi:hypothetical protein